MNLNIKGICPVCNGTKRAIYFGNERNCFNCGGQYMFGEPTGEVPIRSDGIPCKHEYTSTTIGRCYTKYECKHCGDKHSIDSGD